LAKALAECQRVHKAESNDEDVLDEANSNGPFLSGFVNGIGQIAESQWAAAPYTSGTYNT
jgi:hypothetical protein